MSLKDDSSRVIAGLNKHSCPELLLSQESFRIGREGVSLSYTVRALRGIDLIRVIACLNRIVN